MHGYAVLWLVFWLGLWAVLSVPLAITIGHALRGRRYELERAQHVRQKWEHLVPAVGSMILAEERAHLSCPEGCDCGPCRAGYCSQCVLGFPEQAHQTMLMPAPGPLEAPLEWTGPLLRELRDGPTVFDDLESSALSGQEGPEGIPGSADGPRNVDAAGAGVELEPCGVTAPPAPDDRWQIVSDGPNSWGPGSLTPEPSRLLRTSGEIMRADMMADVCADIARRDAETEVWLAEFRQRWAAA